MAYYAPSQSLYASPFTRAVVQAMRKLYPESLADKSFDNTGLLLEAPFDPIRRQMNSVLLTIDLTKAVADEAIERKDCVVVSYHTPIFHGLKALTLKDTQQQSLLRLALEGISVYSPHTAVDAAPGGNGDWLADIVTGSLGNPEPETHTATEKDNPPPEPEAEEAKDKNGDGGLKPPSGRPGLSRSYSRPEYPSPRTAAKEKAELKTDSMKHTRETIKLIANPPSGFESAGYGRLVTFEKAQPLTHLIERIARGVGTPKGFPVAIPQGKSVEDITVKTVAVCGGSGGSVFHGVQADLYFTGELVHHETLSFIEQGSCVISLFHTNSERGYLHRVMKAKLENALRGEWKAVREEELEKSKEENWSGEWEDALEDEDVTVEVSERDRDPYGIVILQGSEVEGTPIEAEEK